MKYRFILDGMLGSLARWLRIIGYDTLYYSDKEDEDLRSEAMKTGRILVTRDEELYKRAVKEGQESFLVKSEAVTVQLKELVDALGLILLVQVSRCPRCNGALSPVEKDDVRDRVPDASFEAFDEFWACVECGAVYWRGSHWAQIEETLNKIES